MALRARGKEIINSIASVSTGKLPLYKKLWENPNPTSAFVAQTITLLSDDYDFLLWVTALGGGNTTTTATTISPKGQNALLSFNSGNTFLSRVCAYSASTRFSIQEAVASAGGATPSVANAYCVPVAIYGFKKDVDIQSVIASVSTEASKCYLSDGVTSVADKLAESYVLTIPTSGYSTVSKNIWNTGAKNYQAITISVDVNNNPLTNFHSGMKEDYPINIDGSQSDFGKLYAFEIGEGQVTFYFTSAPSSAFNVLIREAV